MIPCEMPDTVPNQRPRVLLVDDDPDVLEAMGIVLDDDGWHVVSVGNGLDAQRVDASRLTVAIVDMTLPGASGLDVAKSLLAQRPELPVVFMSGFEREFCQVPLAPRVKWLAKPFDVAELLAVVADLKSTFADARSLSK